MLLIMKICCIYTEQVQEVKLLDVTLGEQLSWKKHNEIKKMGRAIAFIRRCSYFLTTASRVLVIHYLTSTTAWQFDQVQQKKKALSKLHIAQNKTARLALSSLLGVRQGTEEMHCSLPWLRISWHAICWVICWGIYVIVNNQIICTLSKINKRDQHHYKYQVGS